jgi:hypothetical protein
MAIAAKASAMISQARQELLSLQREGRAAAPEPDGSLPLTDRQNGMVAVTNPAAAHTCDARCTPHDTAPDTTTPTSTITAPARPTVLALQSYYAAAQRQAAFSITV